ncbi:conserved hypothetical protein [Photobacterium leiognathi lrivu.4.1]|uniref:Uncharacterized protein n=1 Tax=Photobacterium leiognathi lrivu.4.1 TaxID=1248232 RepID=V5F846_PHOLE|nr:hypothetical protein [Photobacterium leiognathi]GAD31529.1 conserved hypothetical protein [Photobacterium leiognathi lrivu.4.1]
MTCLKEYIKKNFIFIEIEKKHVGCGFIIKVEECLYCITAGHVPFGKNFNNLKNVTMKNINGDTIDEINLLSNEDFAKEYDLAIYQVWGEPSEYIDVNISEHIVNSTLISIAYIKPTTVREPYFIEHIRHSEDLKGNEVKYYVYAGNPFNNFQKDTHGADYGQGLSGSPLILFSNDNKVYFHGVITRIPNDGVGSMLCSRSLIPIKEYIDKISFYKKEVFDSDFKLTSYSRELLKRERFESWVKEWKDLPENAGYYDNLEHKLEIMHGEYYKEELPDELAKIMIGDECIKNDIESNSELYDAYHEISKTTARNEMHEYVESSRDAVIFYRKTYSDHLETMNEDLDSFKLKKTDKMKLAQYDIATWMAACKLRFTKI